MNWAQAADIYGQTLLYQQCLDQQAHCMNLTDFTDKRDFRRHPSETLEEYTQRLIALLRETRQMLRKCQPDVTLWMAWERVSAVLNHLDQGGIVIVPSLRFLRQPGIYHLWQQHFATRVSEHAVPIQLSICFQMGSKKTITSCKFDNDALNFLQQNPFVPILSLIPPAHQEFYASRGPPLIHGSSCDWQQWLQDEEQRCQTDPEFITKCQRLVFEDEPVLEGRTERTLAFYVLVI